MKNEYVKVMLAGTPRYYTRKYLNQRYAAVQLLIARAVPVIDEQERLIAKQAWGDSRLAKGSRTGNKRSQLSPQEVFKARS